MLTVLEQYEEMMKTHDPELYVTKKQLEDLEKRGYGVAIVEYTVQGGKIKLVERSIKLTNVSNANTGKVGIVF